MSEVLLMCGPRRTRTRFQYIQNTPRNNIQNNIQNDIQYQTPVLNIDTNFIYCHSCNFSKNIKKAKFCQQCGDELQTCPISKMNFSQNQDYVQCGNCKWTFHKTHLDKWMRKNQSCPICSGPPSEMIVGKIGINPIQV